MRRAALLKTIASLRERTKRAQANMARIYEGAGHSHLKIEQLCDRWQVSVQTGDLLRILDAAEQSLKQAEVASRVLPEKRGIACIGDYTRLLWVIVYPRRLHGLLRKAIVARSSRAACAIYPRRKPLMARRWR